MIECIVRRLVTDKTSRLKAHFGYVGCGCKLFLTDDDCEGERVRQFKRKGVEANVLHLTLLHECGTSTPDLRI